MGRVLWIWTCNSSCLCTKVITEPVDYVTAKTGGWDLSDEVTLRRIAKISMHRISFLIATVRTRSRLICNDSHADLSLSPAKMAQRAETTQRQFFTQNQPCSSGRKQYKQATYAASTPNVCIAPCLRDQGI